MTAYGTLAAACLAAALLASCVGRPVASPANAASPEGTGAMSSANVTSAPMSSPAEYAGRPISAEAGADYFLHTGAGDPYAAGMAYPVFLALMEAYPTRSGATGTPSPIASASCATPTRRGIRRRSRSGFT